jgi:hypothetical protein
MVEVVLEEFSLLYTVDDVRLPLDTETAELGELTSSYLNDYFEILFDTSNLVSFLSSNTAITDTFIRFGQPIRVFYQTTISFAPESVIPPTNDLNSFVEGAFSGTNLETYLTEVQTTLPESNFYASTVSIEYMVVEPQAIRDSETDDTEGNAEDTTGDGGSGAKIATPAVATAAGAGVVMILMVGILVYQRRNVDDDDNDVSPMGKFLTEGEDGHITVAGETYEGGSSQDSASHYAPDDPTRTVAASSSPRPEQGYMYRDTELPVVSENVNEEEEEDVSDTEIYSVATTDDGDGSTQLEQLIHDSTTRYRTSQLT